MPSLAALDLIDDPEFPDEQLSPAPAGWLTRWLQRLKLTQRDGLGRSAPGGPGTVVSDERARPRLRNEVS